MYYKVLDISNGYLVTLYFYNNEPSFLNFSFLVLLGIHRNPDWKEFLESCESFWRKSWCSTPTDLNPGFCRPWNMLGIFFVNVIFIKLQKSLLAKKNFEFHAQVQKCHFGNFSILAKWHFWTSKTGEQNQKVLILWWFIIVKIQCEHVFHVEKTY